VAHTRRTVPRARPNQTHCRSKNGDRDVNGNAMTWRAQLADGHRLSVRLSRWIRVPGLDNIHTTYHDATNGWIRNARRQSLATLGECLPHPAFVSSRLSVQARTNEQDQPSRGYMTG
jgi:hypothetical protein